MTASRTGMSSWTASSPARAMPRCCTIRTPASATLKQLCVLMTLGHPLQEKQPVVKPKNPFWELRTPEEATAFWDKEFAHLKRAAPKPPVGPTLVAAQESK